MKPLYYEGYVEYSDGIHGLAADACDTPEDAEKITRERINSEVTSGYIEREHGGVESIIVRKSEMVKRIEL